MNNNLDVFYNDQTDIIDNPKPILQQHQAIITTNAFLKKPSKINNGNIIVIDTDDFIRDFMIIFFVILIFIKMY